MARERERGQYLDIHMEKTRKEALQVTKEIVVKFVEAGRITPANFPDTFPAVDSVVLKTLAASESADPAGEQSGAQGGGK